MHHRKLRLMFIIDFVYTRTGGTENQLLRLIQGLDQERFEIHLVSLRDTEWLRQHSEELDCTLKTYDVIKLKNPVTLFQFASLARHIREMEPDLVMTLFPLSNIAAVVAARLAKVPVIVSTRRDYGLWLDRRSLPLLRLANRFVSGIVTNAEAVKELTSRAESFPASKIKVIYNGIDGLDRGPDHRTSRELTQEFGIPHDHKVIGIVANLRPMKRHATLIHAAERILKTRQDVDFVLVGEGPLRGELEALIAAKGLRRHFHFAGRREAIQPLLSIFQVGVNCSANEGLSNAIMEYMAYGVPCVVSRAGGNLELVEHGVNGYTFELDDDQALSGYILELLGNQEMRERFSARSKEIVHKRLSTARMVREYEEYFLGLLSAGETWTPERFARVRDSGSASCESGTSDR